MESGTAPAAPTPPRRSTLLAAAAAAALLAVARDAPRADEPFDWSTASACAVTYTFAFERVFERVGYANADGVPRFYAAPATGRPVVGPAYVRHPVLFRGFVHAAARVFGRDERGLRWPPTLFAALGAALLVALAAPRTGVAPAFAGALFALATPMGWQFGRLPNYEPYVAALLLGGLLLHRARRAGPVAGYWPVYGVFLLGTQTTYPAYFLAPALWAYELLLPRGERRLGRTLWLLPLGVAGFVANCVYVGAVLDRAPWELARELLGAAEDAPTTAAVAGGGLFAAWKHGLTHAWAGYGVAGALAASAAAALGLRRGDREGRAVAAALWIPALLHAGLFPYHAAVHEFWWYYALAGVGYAAAVGVAAVARGGSAARRALAAVVVVAAVAASLYGVREKARALPADPGYSPAAVGREVGRFVGPDDALTTNFGLREAEFYVPAFLWREEGPPAAVESTAAILPALLRSERAFVRRCVLLLAAEEKDAVWRGPGRVAYLPADEVATNLPALSLLIGRRGLLSVVIE